MALVGVDDRTLPEDHELSRPGLDALSVAVGGTVCLLPFLSPAGPGNTAVADIGISVCIACGLLWVTRRRLPLAVPYSAGVLLLVLGGALAAMLADAPLGTGLVLLQDLFLLLWAATLALGRYNAALVSAATHAWCRLAPAYAAVVVLAYLIGFTPLSGVSTEDGVRAAYTFGDPNLAGNYLVLSLVLMGACQRPRAAWIRRSGYLFVVVAIAFTGSNGAALTLLIALAFGFSLARYRSQGPLAALLTLTTMAAGAALTITLILPRVDVDQIRAEAAGSVPLLRDSLGRSAGSTSERETLVDESLRLYFTGDATGYGPARTKATLQAGQAPYVKETHDDYLAALLERGVIGFAGLILLGLAIGLRCVRLVVGEVPAQLADAVPRAWLLAAGFPVMAVAASFYEVLHFRHLWTWLGILAAVTLCQQDLLRRKPEESR